MTEKTSFGLEAINKAWKSTCRILLKDEIGDINNYEEYLSRYNDLLMSDFSDISKKKVSITPMPFCKGAKFISDDEAEKFDAKMRGKSLNINKLKDIDSVLENIGEIRYSGNIIRGNSREVEESDCCFNSSYVYKSTDMYDSKYIAYSCNGRRIEYAFGSNWLGDSRYLIKCFETYEQTRCMEALRAATISDCYYVARVDDCANCMFSFNQKNKRNMIGNLQLTQEEYSKLKEKLIEDIREALREKKSIPSIVDIIRG